MEFSLMGGSQNLIYTGQLLAEAPMEQPQRVPVRKCLLMKTLSGLVSTDMMDPHVGSPWMALPSGSAPLFSLFFLWIGTFLG